METYNQRAERLLAALQQRAPLLVWHVPQGRRHALPEESVSVSNATGTVTLTQPLWAEDVWAQKTNGGALICWELYARVNGEGLWLQGSVPWAGQEPRALADAVIRQAKALLAEALFAWRPPEARPSHA